MPKPWEVTPKLEGGSASGISQAAPGVRHNGPHLKYFYTNAHGVMSNKEKLEALAWSERFCITGISETRWDEPCAWCAMLDGHRPSRRDRQGRRGGRAGM